ncbi:MAG: L-threonylcarbamoyladenylate synthase [Candidatus Gastranaerophilaceae bacterium]
MKQSCVNVEELGKKLENGEIVVYPTDTVWGLGCLPDNEIAVDKIYEIKGRDRSKPLILMSDDIANLLPYVAELPEKAIKLIYKHFPGALTIVVKKSDLTPDFVTSGKNTVGIRVPANKTFSELCKKIPGHVLATTSANFSGDNPVKNYEEAFFTFSGDTELIFEDEGEKPKCVASTVVGVFDDTIKIFRQGSIEISEG